MSLDQGVNSEYQNYNLFYKFIQTYAPTGFKGINPSDQFILELEEMMEKNDQFFYVGDMLNLKILYVSKGCLKMTGINATELTPYHVFELNHKDDIERFHAARVAFFKMSQDLFKEEKGESFISTSLRIRRPDGEYIQVLYQNYLFFQEFPVKTVYVLKVHTDINWIRKIKNGFFYYAGKDISLFRYPDEKMLNKGNIFSPREFEVIKLVGLGLSSEQIGAKLFLSPHTVNKHRRNILEKSGMSHVSDLIYKLKEQGLL